jgi:uncharacterized Tic20 family protein
MDTNQDKPSDSNNPSKDNLADTLGKFLKIEDGPKFGGGKLSEADDRLFCGLAHPFAIIIWLWKKNESPAVDAHGKEALNFGITYLLCVWLPLTIVLRVLSSGFLFWPIYYLVLLTNLVLLGLVIYGLVLARQGKLLRYPFNLRLIK